MAARVRKDGIKGRRSQLTTSHGKVCNLPDKTFKIDILRKLNELQEKIVQRQFKGIKKTK